MAWLSDNLALLLRSGVDLVVVVGLPGYDRLDFKIKGRRRRSCLPFETGGIPWIIRSGLAITHGPEKIDHGQQITDCEDGCTRGGEDIKDLIFRRVLIVAAGHAEITENELRE